MLTFVQVLPGQIAAGGGGRGESTYKKDPELIFNHRGLQNYYSLMCHLGNVRCTEVRIINT